MYVTSWIIFGIASISKIAPDRMKFGRNPDKTATCDATLWSRHMDDIKIPCVVATRRKTLDESKYAANEPRNGTSNKSFERNKPPIAAAKPRRKYGINFPTNISNFPTEAARVASIVPRSHSLATTRAVSNVPIIARIIAIEPGIKLCRVICAGLYIVFVSKSILPAKPPSPVSLSRSDVHFINAARK